MGFVTIKEALTRIIKEEDLTADEMEWVVRELLEGRITEAQWGGFMVAMRMKGETVAEREGAERALAGNVYSSGLKVIRKMNDEMPETAHHPWRK